MTKRAPDSAQWNRMERNTAHYNLLGGRVVPRESRTHIAAIQLTVSHAFYFQCLTRAKSCLTVIYQAYHSPCNAYSACEFRLRLTAPL